MNVPVFVVNAFAETPFGGNPAAIVLLENWLNDSILQEIAAQHNLAETAFVVPEGEDFSIRWMTPTVEVKLCGHATLGSAHIYFNHLFYPKEKITFHSQSGPLHVTKTDNGKLLLDFPADTLTEVKETNKFANALSIRPVAVYRSSFDYMVVANNQAEIENLLPDFGLLNQLESRGTIVTAKGDSADFVSRCFFPQSGIDEDPVTGSAHTAMTPYWASKLGKDSMTAIQLSRRRGYLDCTLAGDRVLIGGNAITYLEGEIIL
ncbi:MAG TPA: PhzF family phenazine biosynthesis protein [Puia sp.]|nr:PhzF family phenazine biosynthesis protein [Puia sp.]